MKRIVRWVVYREGETWVAAAVELWIVAQGSSAADAVRKLAATFEAEFMETSQRLGAPMSGIPPAPDAIRELYDAAGPDMRGTIAYETGE